MSPSIRSILVLALAATAIAACQKPATAQATDQAQDAASSAVPVSATVASSAPLRPDGATLDGPDGQSITFLYYSILGRSLPLKDWADDDARRATSDEFARQRAASDNLAAYQEKFAEAGKIGHVVIAIATQLSDYDMQHGEFYLEAFSPVTTVDFQYKDRDVKLAFVNGEKAQHWRIAADQADAALKQNYGQHTIQVEAHADVVGVEPGMNGGKLLLKVTGYRILTNDGHGTLAELQVP